jgi:tripartite-type tricarboxylate transporter receptor subunit TctC
MKLRRRQFLHLAAGAVALPVTSRFATAQSYPARPVRIVVSFPAGQAADSVARLMAQSLSERLGQQFVIENRPGAGGNIGTEVVVRAPPDGYTLLMEVITSNAINATLYANLNFNGSPGIGTPPHAFGELFKMMAGVDMVHVPYRGSYLPDLLGGQVQVPWQSTWLPGQGCGMLFRPHQ